MRIDFGSRIEVTDHHVREGMTSGMAMVEGAWSYLLTTGHIRERVCDRKWDPEVGPGYKPHGLSPRDHFLQQPYLPKVLPPSRTAPPTMRSQTQKAHSHLKHHRES